MSWSRDKPIFAVVGFNLFTLFVFITAPVRWNTENLVELCFFVLLCQLLVFLGFRLGRHKRPATTHTNKLPLFCGDSLVNCLFTIYILTFPISYAYRMEFAPFDIPGMVSKLVAGIQDPHAAYAWNIDKVTVGPIPWRVYFAISIFNQLFFAAGFLHWRRLKRVKKVVFVILIAIELFYWVGIATSVGVVTLVTTFGLSSMFWRARVGRWRIRSVAGHVLFPSLLLVGSIAFFSYNLYRRSNLAELDIAQYEIAQSSIIVSHPALAILPQPLQPTYLMVVSYLGQGYYHTCFAFDLDFRWTRFVGNNPALIALAARLGVDVWEDTYMHRLQRQGIDEYGVWHSAYTWFASDVSFYGVPVVLFFLGYLYGFSWAHGVRGDFLSRIVFIMFGNMLLFLFANNTYLSSVFYAFMVFVPLWMFTRFFDMRWVARMSRRPADRGRVVGAEPAPRNAMRVET
jgi:hypothetical protein